MLLILKTLKKSPFPTLTPKVGEILVEKDSLDELQNKILDDESSMQRKWMDVKKRKQIMALLFNKEALLFYGIDLFITNKPISPTTRT
jgi:hypothetical protein